MDYERLLIENDYEVLRRYEGRSSLRTYLAAVIRVSLLLQESAVELGPILGAEAGGNPPLRPSTS